LGVEQNKWENVYNTVSERKKQGIKWMLLEGQRMEDMIHHLGNINGLRWKLPIAVIVGKFALTQNCCNVFLNKI
jgi:hypothetical protein